MFKISAALFLVACALALTVNGQNVLVDNANYQCRNFFGSEASFCQDSISNMCTRLSCRLTASSTQCVPANFGAANRTACGIKKSCQNLRCADDSSLNSDAKCIFGDNIIPKGLVLANSNLQIPVGEQMSCENFMRLLLEKGKSPFQYCQDQAVRQFCCQTCKLMDSLTCEDKSKSDPSCKPAKLRCFDGLCLNGAKCTNVDNNDNLYGFRCDCSVGYLGLFCELKSPCDPNPCNNGGTCLRLNSIDYKCLCPNGYTDSTCSTGLMQAQADGAPRISSDVVVGSYYYCSSTLCSSRGTCVVYGTGYYCVCSWPYYGNTCQYAQAVCSPNPCYNGGTCTTNSAWPYYYYCTCPTNYYGSNCQYYSGPPKDVDTTYCQWVRSRGLCAYYYNSCPVSCANYTTDCSDLLTGCFSSYCSYLVNFSPHPCRKTCGRC